MTMRPIDTCPMTESLPLGCVDGISEVNWLIGMVTGQNEQGPVDIGILRDILTAGRLLHQCPVTSYSDVGMALSQLERTTNGILDRHFNVGGEARPVRFSPGVTTKVPDSDMQALTESMNQFERALKRDVRENVRRHNQRLGL